MTKTVTTKKQWLETRSGLLVMAVLGLIAFYAFGSWAVDSGSIFHYFITLGFLILSIYLIVRSFKK